MSVESSGKPDAWKLARPVWGWGRGAILRPTPLIVGLLVVEGLLWLSERYQWFWFNERTGWTVLIAVASVGVAMLLMHLWFVIALLFRVRFQFSLRSLMILTVAVAIPCSWLSVEMKKAREQGEVVDEIKKLGGFVEYDYQCDTTLGISGKPPEPPWLRNLLCDDFFSHVCYVNASFNTAEIDDVVLAHLSRLTYLQRLELNSSTIADAGLAYLGGLTQLQRLDLGETEITDAGLVHLTGLTQLQELGLSNTQITDAGLVHLAGLTQLKSLELTNTKITDAGLARLTGLTKLQQMYLGSTQITDAGLAYLAGLTQLELLTLNNTQITDKAVKKLQQALPNCESFP